MARRTEVRQSVRNELWRLANGMCQRCRQELDTGTRVGTPTAHVAHIVALGDGGQRSQPETSMEAKNAVSNLLLLCSTCHDVIDKDGGQGASVEELRKLKTDHEAWAADLRRAGNRWNVTYSSVDYLNMPRVAMLEGGSAVQQVAQRAGLDATRPFRGQGLAPGIFVGSVSHVFESWRQRAMPLGECDLSVVQQGMYVTFHAPMRGMNTPTSPPAGLTGDWKLDPYLNFSVAGRMIMIRYDPDWLTTTTAFTDLRSAGEGPITYAGFGLVVAVSADVIRVSALVFGQPATPEGSYVNYLMRSSNGQLGRFLAVDDFGDRSTNLGNGGSSAVTSGSRPEAPVSVALHFDEDDVVPGQIEKEVFRQLIRVVPEFRRDLLIAVGSMVTRPVTRELPAPGDVAGALLGGAPPVWSTHSIAGLNELLRNSELAFAAVRGVRKADLRDLHEALLESSASYLGAIEIKLDRPMHEYCYGLFPRFRLVDCSLRLRYSASEYYGDEGCDERPHELFYKWEEMGWFESVMWEEDAEESGADLRRAADAMEWMRRVMNSVD